jgi:threonine-phosphate decarboxylase
VWQVGEELGIAASEILDFSANINPRGLPPQARERLKRDTSDARLLSFYPDPSARRLRNALSEQLGVTSDAIVIGPGAESLLAPILRYLQPTRALVPVPAFSEYRRVCEQEQIEFSPFPLERSELFRVPVERLCAHIEAEPYGVVLLNNPHNPSGAMLEQHQVKRVLDAASYPAARFGAGAKPLAHARGSDGNARGSDRSHDRKGVVSSKSVKSLAHSTRSSSATLLLDEAFIDYVPDASLVREAANQPHLIVLRSLTKFYGCPALRVGYAVAHPDTVRAIRSLLPTWSVTQLASDTLAEAVADREYAEASRRENAVERERLADSLSGLGLVVFPPAANYLLLELLPDMPTASELRSRLIARHRMLIRNCDSYEGLAPGRYVRIAVRSSEENWRLIQALAEELRVP